MSKTISGLYHGTSGEKAMHELYEEIAVLAVKKKIEATKDSKKRAMVVGAYDINTGHVSTAFADAPPEKIAEELIKRADMIGGINSMGVSERNVVGVCAEFHAINELLLKGSKMEDIRLTKALRPRTGKEMPYCENCLAMFSDIINKKGEK